MCQQVCVSRSVPVHRMNLLHNVPIPSRGILMMLLQGPQTTWTLNPRPGPLVLLWLLGCAQSLMPLGLGTCCWHCVCVTSSESPPWLSCDCCLYATDDKWQEVACFLAASFWVLLSIQRAETSWSCGVPLPTSISHNGVRSGREDGLVTVGRG